MGYMHIDNLYRDDRIFKFQECFALEKIHGTSAHISWKNATGEVLFFSGGENRENFLGLFDQTWLRNRFLTYELDSDLTIYGEAYGGKQQGMRTTYGDATKFVVFDVRKGETWLTVPEAYGVAQYFGLEFVDFARIPAQLSAIDAERDKPSTQASRNGITEPKKREGVVLRPITEERDDRGNRIITKHKNVEFMETKTPRFVDPDKAKVLKEANAIADEWVTEMRLQHVLDRAKVLRQEAIVEMGATAGDLDTFTIEETGIIIRLMLEDVTREAKGEIVESKEAMRAIGSATARLYKKWLNEQIAVRS